MLEALNMGRAPSGINESIPQVQPMSEKEDSRVFLMQQARRTSREAYAATLLPLLNPVPEQIRQIFVMEQLTQQLPKSIQMYVRERKPSSLDQLLDLILTYFRAHHGNFTPMKNVSKQMTSHAHSGANVSTKTTASAKTESSNPSGCDAATTTTGRHRNHIPMVPGTPGRTSRTSSATNPRQRSTYPPQSPYTIGGLSCLSCLPSSLGVWLGCHIQVVPRHSPSHTARSNVPSACSFCYQTTGMDPQCMRREQCIQKERLVLQQCLMQKWMARGHVRMLVAVAPRQVLPYPAIYSVAGMAPGYVDPQGSNSEQLLPLSNETKTFKCYHGLDGDLSQP